MDPRETVAVVVGTRPEAIKMAPVVEALRRRGRYRPVLVSTGQHREMLDQTLEVFGLKADVELSVMSPGQTLHDVTARTLQGLKGFLHETRPAWTLVHGDTTTAFAAALAAYYEQLPVAHVEAGLRSGDRYSPFPEEMNRRMIDQLAEKCFVPTKAAGDALLREGIAPARIHLTGNTVVDALAAVRERVRDRPAAIPGLEAVPPGARVILVTAHRRESFGAPFEEICRALARILRELPDAWIVYPVHLNPQVNGTARRLLGGERRALLLPPVSYLQFVTLLERASFVLTDSGGVQEEAPSFGKPLLVLRDVTERPEGIAAGVARLVGTSEQRIVAEALRLANDPRHHAAMARATNPYGDGRAAARIAELLEGERTASALQAVA